MRSLEDSGKNLWTIADFRVMIVAVNLGPQQIGWNHDDWGRIVFRDESRFQLCPDDNQRRVRRRPGERTDPAFPYCNPHRFLTRSYARSSDLSPVEHVWDMMRKRLHLRGNVVELARQLEQIWQEIPQETIRVLYHSMPRRVATCIQAKDGSTL
ncbi:transposable element Tc1 transposase [Trichonephila clavipes]|uniref:Transposable element Tc1 transposase n=1 Tax=Trichonephila clavipes TaxID=2585209 RepID=A0A8X6VBX7_TRICX|nr:transposable element Tc1 transposase [Trichonephila clavipes]